MAKEEKASQRNPDLPLYNAIGDKTSTPLSKEALNADYSVISPATMNMDNIYAEVLVRRNQPAHTEKVKGRKGSKGAVHWLAIFALVAVLVIIMASILALFVNIAKLREATDSLQQQWDNNSIQVAHEKLTEEYTAAVALLNNSVESTYQNIMNTTQELNNLIQVVNIQDITSYRNKTDLLFINLGMDITRTNPASSCAALPPSAPTGYYWVRASNGSAVCVYCDMTRSCGGVTGGWMRVAELDMTNSSHQCPSGLRLNNIRTCCITFDTPACSSVIFHVHSLYFKICGRIQAYQLGSPNTFADDGRGVNLTIEGNYIDGVSLTHGHPRQHIWSFAGALDEVGSYPDTNCPCTNISQAINASQPPADVGDDYFCDTTSSGRYTNGLFYGDDPLWDGAGCGPLNTCCSFNHPPWFYKQLPQPTTDDIEMRVCRDQPSNNEDILIKEIEIYTQ